MKVIVTAPGKLILHGEHSVVYGKEALACAIDLRTSCNLEMLEFDGNTALAISAEELKLRASLDTNTIRGLLNEMEMENDTPFLSPNCISKIKESTNIDANPLKNLAYMLIVALYIAVGRKDCLQWSITATIKSDVPVGAGLGSSASYATCLATVFLIAFRRIDAPTSARYELTATHRKTINELVFEAEKLIHGSPSGIDNSVCVYGTALSFKEGKINLGERLPHLKVLLVNTQTPRSTKDLVAGVKERYQKHPTIFGAIFDAIEHIVLSAKDCYRQLAEASVKMLCDEERRLYSHIEDYVRLNHELLRSLGVSHPALEKVVNICQKHGLSSKLTGAGGGGCAFSIIPPGYSESKLDSLKMILQEEGFESWISRIGCDGVHVESFQEK